MRDDKTIENLGKVIAVIQENYEGIRGRNKELFRENESLRRDLQDMTTRFGTYRRANPEKGD